MSTPAKCQSMTTSGKPCRSRAMEGSQFCSQPTHQDGSATAAALRRDLEQAVQSEASRAAELALVIEDLIGLPPPGPAPSGEDRSLALKRCRAAFVKWLGEAYDLDSLYATLAVVAVERLLGDPVWLLIISGAGNTKTETVNAADGVGAKVVSTIISDAALLSGTPAKEVEVGATGGLLRAIGSRGVLAIKDVTSILSMQRDTRASVLGALREIYDGRWSREVGTGGGMTLAWKGRLVIIGAVTTAWDTHHSVIASMGDRFLTIRTDSSHAEGRLVSGRQALANTGSETAMRAELADEFGKVIAAMDPTPIDPSDEESERLLLAADLVTRARTSVERDFQGNVIGVHALEAPTRLTKQLGQVLRGCVAIGIDRDEAMRLAIRCARDSMPPLRLRIIEDLLAFQERDEGFFSPVQDIRKRLRMPRTTVDRELQGMQMLGLVQVFEEEVAHGEGTRIKWSYRLAEQINPVALRYVPVM